MSQGDCRLYVAWYAIQRNVIQNLFAEILFKPPEHERDGLIGDVYPDPPPFETLCDRRTGATAAVGVEHHIALVAARLDDALEERFGFLRRVTQTFLALDPAQHRNIVPPILVRYPFALIEVPLLIRHP